MTRISNYINSAYNYTKQAVSFGAKVVGTTMLDLSLSRVIRKSGIAAPLTQYTRYWKHLGFPFVKINAAVYNIMQSTFPTLFINVDNPSPYNMPKCKLINASYKCEFPVASVLQGITEEILFRGLLQQKILPWIASKLPTGFGLGDKSTRILITSLIFAAAHENRDDLTQQIAGGLIKGLVAESSHSLTIPILSHILHNALVEYLYLTDESGLLAQLTS